MLGAGIEHQLDLAGRAGFLGLLSQLCTGQGMLIGVQGRVLGSRA
ncbi:MAG: hypothetical protein ACRDQY_00070 [Pseudonocardiaceae bacterium]